MNGRAWAPDVTVRERRWAPVFVVAVAAAIAIAVALFITTSDGNDPTMLIAAFLVAATITIVASVGLRVRLLGDRAGIRQERTFVPWYEVAAIEEPMERARGGSLQLTGSRKVTLPPSTLERHRRGLVALREEAARHGVGIVADPAVSPLRSLPMDREPLPAGIARALGSAGIALLVLAVTLLPMLPPSSPGLDSAPVRRFPEDALRPMWTRYLLPPPNPQNLPARVASGKITILQRVEAPPGVDGRVVFDGAPVAEAAEVADTGVTYRYSQRTPASLLTGFTPSGRAGWQDLILDAGQIRGSAANNSGLLLSQVIPEQEIGGGLACCKLSLIDGAGRLVWSKHMAGLSDVGPILASDDRFFLVHNGGASRRERKVVEVTVLSPDGSIEDVWEEEFPGYELDSAWISGDGLVFVLHERKRFSSYDRSFLLIQVDNQGAEQWRLPMAGMLGDLVETRQGIAVLKTDPDPRQNYYLAGPPITALGIRNGSVEWTQTFPVDIRGNRSLLNDGSQVYVITRGFGPAGPQMLIQRMNTATGTLSRSWEIATVRQYPTFLVTDGIAYLVSESGPPYSLQRYDWPPSDSGATRTIDRGTN